VIVGTLRIELAVFEATSLKDKRRMIKSLKDRLAHRFNVSVAEVEELDSHRRAVLGAAMVANDRRFVESCLDKMIDHVRLDPKLSLIDYESEIWQ
jgi:hypothetical protein